MSFIYDYFRARDSKSAMSIAPDGVIKQRERVDLVSLRNLEPYVQIGILIAFTRNVDWTVNTVRSNTLVPPNAPKTKEDLDCTPDDASYWLYDHHLEAFDLQFREDLAFIGEPQFQRLAEEWTRTEEFQGFDLESLWHNLRLLVELAKRAQAANDRMFLSRPVG